MDNFQFPKKDVPSLPKGWEIKRLGELFDVKSSKRVHKKDWKTEGVPFYRAREVVKLSENGFVNNELFISNELYEKYTKGKGAPKENDIVVSAVGTLGKCYIVKKDDKFYIKDASVLWFKKESDTDSRYIDYAFKSDLIVKQVMHKSMGATVGTLTITRAKNIQIPIPPLPEQKRIVSILDRAFEAIDKAKANAEQNLKNAKELFESYLNRIFEEEGEDWEEKKLGKVALDFGRGKSKHRPRNWKGLFNGKYPFIQTGNVRNANKFIINYSQTYNETGLAQSKLWEKGTICITIAANIAETAILSFDSCFPDSIIGLLTDPKKANTDYTYYLLQYYKTYLQKLGKGSAQDNINLGTFEKETFPFPPLETQKQIVQKLDQLQAETKKMEALYQKKIEDLEELKKSILQKAFSGELS